MARPNRGSREAPKKDGPRTNKEITSPTVRLIGAEGENFGVVALREALDKAGDAGLDLVEISPHVEPPVCKITDYGKYKYQLQKKDAENRKKQKTIDVKEIQLRPMIEEHDYQVKFRNAERFIAAGNKVKVVLRFRGREMAHKDLGFQVINRLVEDLGEAAKIDAPAALNGRQIVMVLSPR